jgi:hypothetical protein
MVNRREDKPKLNAEQVIPLSEVPKRFTKAVHIRLPVTRAEEDGLLDRVREVLMAHKGAVPVLFCFIYPDGKLVFVETHQHFSVTPSDKLVNDLEALLGEAVVWLKVDTAKLTTATNARAPRPWEKRPSNGEE